MPLLQRMTPSTRERLSCPWWDLCFDPRTPNSSHVSAPSLQRLFLSPIAASPSVSNKLNTLLAPDSPTTSARCRRLPLPPRFSLFLPRLLSHRQVHVSIMWDCYVAAHSWKLLLSAAAFLFYIGLFLTCACLCLRCLSVFLLTSGIIFVLSGTSHP